jgi:flagellar motor switch protein FliG
VLCIALGPKEAAKILRELSSEQVEEVTREIAAMQEVEPEVVRDVVKEFHTAAKSKGPLSRGGIQTAQQLLEQALGPSRATEVVGRIARTGGQEGLRRLKKASPVVLAGLLRGEHPQTIAVVLSRLDALSAARVLQELPQERGAEILLRMARMEPIAPETIASIEEGLTSSAHLSLKQERTETGGPAAVAKLLNAAGPGVDEELLRAMESKNAELTTQVKQLMFVFEDLVQIDGKGIQRILREIDTKDLALALKAASPELAHHIKSNMSERAAGALDEEIELLGAVRVKDVEEAHGRIIEVTRQLEQEGEIVIRRQGGGSDEFIS